MNLGMHGISLMSTDELEMKRSELPRSLESIDAKALFGQLEIRELYKKVTTLSQMERQVQSLIDQLFLQFLSTKKISFAMLGVRKVKERLESMILHILRFLQLRPKQSHQTKYVPPHVYIFLMQVDDAFWNTFVGYSGGAAEEAQGTGGKAFCRTSCQGEAEAVKEI